MTIEVYQLGGEIVKHPSLIFDIYLISDVGAQNILKLYWGELCAETMVIE